MKFCVLGDWHYESLHRQAYLEAVENINGNHPDFVLSIGDLTTGPTTGCRQILCESKQVLDQLKAPFFTIVGNHDMEGRDFATDDENLACFLGAFGYSTPWFAESIGPWLGIFLSNEKNRANPFCRNEVYLGSEQIKWFERTLANAGTRPVLVVCHAPVLGCGLRVIPEQHVCVGNAYVNQNHVPGEIMRILRDHPQVLLWFCGHSHLGQQHSDSLKEVLGIYFVHCGTVHPTQCRDGKRHSRIIEIDDHEWRIRTLDHDLHRIDAGLDVVIQGGANHWLAYRQGKRK